MTLLSCVTGLIEDVSDFRFLYESGCAELWTNARVCGMQNWWRGGVLVGEFEWSDDGELQDWCV